MDPMWAKQSTQKAHIEQERVEAPCAHKQQLNSGQERESTWEKTTFSRPLLCFFPFVTHVHFFDVMLRPKWITG